MKSEIKKSIYRAFRSKALNIPLRVSYRILKPVLPRKIINLYAKFPVNADVRVSIDGAGSFVMVNFGDDIIANELYWKGIHSYEPRALGIVLKLIRNTGVFIDVGANTGLYSLLAASMNPNIRVFGFEPVDTAFDHFVRSVKTNSFGNISPEMIALSDFDGESVFNLVISDSNIPLGSSLRNDVIESTSIRKIKVKTKRLDTYINENSIQNADFMKIDTEGTEDRVLAGAVECIDRFRPVIICEVLSHTNTEPGIHRILDGRKYNYYYVNDNFLEKVEKIIGDPYVVSNYLFIPSERSEELLSGVVVERIEQKIFKKS